MATISENPAITIPSDALCRVPVSVVIPCYRCALTIVRAVNSVVRQTVKPLELILVDDASSDTTTDVLRELQWRHGRNWVRIIALDSNVGAGTARNAGWDAARGEYIAFLDADDIWHPRKLEIQVAIMQQWPDSILSGHRSTKYGVSPVRDAEIAASGVDLVSLGQLLLRNSFITPSAMLRRDIPFRFRSGQRHMEDHLLWLQIAASGAKVLKLQAVLAFTFKPAYGQSGLSGNLWLMEKAECSNYIIMAKSGSISLLAAITLCIYSILKYCKRVLVVALRRFVGE